MCSFYSLGTVFFLFLWTFETFSVSGVLRHVQPEIITLLIQCIQGSHTRFICMRKHGLKVTFEKQFSVFGTCKCRKLNKCVLCRQLWCCAWMWGLPCPTLHRGKSLPLNLPKKSSRSLSSARYNCTFVFVFVFFKKSTLMRLSISAPSQHALPLLCQVFSETKIELALVLFGTDSTDNPLSQDGQYQNIRVHRHLRIPDCELLIEIENQVQPESKEGDCILLPNSFH